MGCPCKKCVTERRFEKQKQTMKELMGTQPDITFSLVPLNDHIWRKWCQEEPSAQGYERATDGVPRFDTSAIIKRYEEHIKRYQWYIDHLRDFEKVAENRRIWSQWVTKTAT